MGCGNFSTLKYLILERKHFYNRSTQYIFIAKGAFRLCKNNVSLLSVTLCKMVLIKSWSQCVQMNSIHLKHVRLCNVCVVNPGAQCK